MDYGVTQVFGPIHINTVGGGSSIENTIHWPGGAGWIIVAGFSASLGVAVTPSLSIPLIGFSGFPGVSPVTVDGEYSFEAPEGDIRFVVSLNGGDSVDWSLVAVARTRK